MLPAWLSVSSDFSTATVEKCCLFISAGCHFETCSDTLFWTAKTVAANELFTSHDVPSFQDWLLLFFLPLHFINFLFLFWQYKHTGRVRLLHHPWPLLGKLFWSRRCLRLPGQKRWALWWCLDFERLTRNDSPFPRLCLESVYSLATATHCMHLATATHCMHY